MIRDNLTATHLYMSYNEISIRPIIPPSMVHMPFKNAKQRIYMSATLGESGDLERSLGVKNIHRIEKPKDWDNQGIGRRLFFFPESMMDEDESLEFAVDMTRQVERSVVLVSNDKEASHMEELFHKKTESDIFKASTLEKTKIDFASSKDAVAILSNRFDGIDFAEDESRLMIIKGTPTGTNLKERFLINRLAASILYHDKIRTRIIQAVGRCTRSTVDYSAICVVGQNLIDELIPRRKRELFHPELQAEIKFGHDESLNKTDKNELIENLHIFLEHGEEWDAADAQILRVREKMNQEGLQFSNHLLEAAKHEVEYQYTIWNGNYLKAMENAEYVLKCLSGPSELKGYRGFWNYLAGAAAWLANANGFGSHTTYAADFFKKAANCTSALPWLHKIANKTTNLTGDNETDYHLTLLIEGLEQNINKMGIANKRNFEREANEIISYLHSHKNFEEGHRRLGEFLGYKAFNPHFAPV